MGINKQAFVEGVKEVLRLAFFAGVTAASGWAAQKLNLLDPTSVYYIVGTAALRFVDKYIHKNDSIKLNGLSF